jgi:hypothetical protein
MASAMLAPFDYEHRSAEHEHRRKRLSTSRMAALPKQHDLTIFPLNVAYCKPGSYLSADPNQQLSNQSLRRPHDNGPLQTIKIKWERLVC